MGGKGVPYSGEGSWHVPPGSVCTSGGGPGLQNQSDPSRLSPQPRSFSSSSDDLTKFASNHLAPRLALLVQKTPALALVIERWEALPEAVRAGILAMVEATTGKAGERCDQPSGTAERQWVTSRMPRVATTADSRDSVCER